MTTPRFSLRPRPMGYRLSLRRARHAGNQSKWSAGANETGDALRLVTLEELSHEGTRKLLDIVKRRLTVVTIQQGIVLGFAARRASPLETVGWVPGFEQPMKDWSIAAFGGRHREPI